MRGTRCVSATAAFYILAILLASGTERAAATQEHRQLLRAQSVQIVAAPGLASCLAAVKGLRAVYPGGSAFKNAASVHNLRTLSTPAAVVYPKSTNQVAAVVRCCLQNGKKAVPRGGGHSYAGFSVQAGKVTVDMSGMSKVTLSKKGDKATIQSGAKLGPVYLKLWQESNGRLGFASGTCPTVGIAGILLGGGFGMSARKHGLSCDRLISVKMVTASGKIVTADAKTNSDLLWASKGGGGGNFGIVTSFTVRPIKLAPVVTLVSGRWPGSTYEAALRWYLQKMPGLDPNYSSDLFLGFDSTQMHGMYFGTVEKAKAVLAASGIDAVGTPQSLTFEKKNWIEAMLAFGVQGQTLSPPQISSLGLGSGVTIASPRAWKAKSSFISKSFSGAALATAAAAVRDSDSRGVGGWLQLHAYGGASAINRVAAADTAFVNRNQIASIQYYASWTASEGGKAAPAAAWLQKTWKSFQPFVSQAAYLNYIDKDLGSGSLSAYYGANLKRLMTVKRQYDPKNYFNFPNSIPVGKA